MAIHEEVVREGAEGIVKQFEMSAASMLFDNLQKNQYQYPEKSTIRELVSNGVDAVNEKLTALEIIQGKAKPEDYYLKRDEPMFADSNYLPEYYDPNWLDPNKNTIKIIYEEALPGVSRDTLRIIDDGVGIGHIINPKTRQSRLQGVIKLGFSTKRNSSIPLGKFGIGAKAALSTGIDSYTMITRHNGQEFRFEIYDYKAESIVPRLNMTTGKENPTFEFRNKDTDELEYRGHYIETTEKNGTEIIVQTKRFHRGTYVSAVQSQLLYFKNIEFTIIRESGEIEEIPIQAEIQYEDDYIILSKNDQFSKPHFVLNGVNYGYVNFQELELEEKRGNIAYKIKPEHVTVNPSRESLVWDDRTRATALAMQDKVAEIASARVALELNATDLIEWIRKCTQALGESMDKESIIGKLADQVDRTLLRPVFTPHPEITYSKTPETFFMGMELIHVFSQAGKSRKTNETIMKVTREKVKTWSEINKPLYLQSGGTSNKREKLLLLKHPQGFIKLKVRDVRMSYQESEDLTAEELAEYTKLKEDTAYYGKWEKRQQIFFKFLKESRFVQIYDDVEVPKEMKDDEEDGEEGDVNAEIKGMTPAEQRALLGQTVCAYPQWASYYTDKNFRWEKVEPTIMDVMKDDADIVYGFQEDEELIHLLANMLTISKDNYSTRTEFYNDKFKLVRISKAAAKHFKNHIYIQDFILSVNYKERLITMHNKLVDWHTGRKIHEVLPRMQFLENFGTFNPEVQRVYRNLKVYKDTHFREVKGSTTFGCNEEMLTSMNEYSNKVIDFQLYIAQHPGNTEAIAAQAKALFDTEEGDETFAEAIGVNMEIYEQLQQLLDYITPLENILNYVQPLLESGKSIPDSLEIEIREIMRNKGIIK